MTYPPYLREKARQLRTEKELTIDEIAERLAVGRTSVHHWVSDLPRPDRCTTRSAPRHRAGQRRGVRAMQRKYRLLREQAYELGRWEFPRLCKEPTFRDFVCMYIGEGSKRCRNTVAICNSDHAVMRLAQHWIVPMTRNSVGYSIQYHADQDLGELRAFWGQALKIEPESIRLQRKSNSKGLAARSWRSKHGVMTLSVGDTYLRARLHAWIDSIEREWLDSTDIGA